MRLEDYDILEKKGVGISGLGSSGIGSPGLGSSGFGSPGLGGSGFGFPGLRGSGFGSPGLGGSRFTQGFQGGVFTAINKITKEKVAIKIIPKNYQDPRFQKEINNEINSLKTIKSENSLKYYTHFEDNGYYYIVTELCDSDLKICRERA